MFQQHVLHRLSTFFCLVEVIFFTIFFSIGVAHFEIKLPYFLASLVVFSLILTGLIILIRYCDEHSLEKHFTLHLVLFFGILLLLQIISVSNLMVTPSWDFGTIFYSAISFVKTGSLSSYEYYFNRYPHNLGILVLEILYYKALYMIGITSISQQIVAGCVLNIVMLDVGILFIILLCRTHCGVKPTLFLLTLCLFFSPYCLYAPIFYTDTISLPFVTFSLYLFFYHQGSTRPRQVHEMLLCGLTLSIGSVIKGTVSILLIAFLLWIFFHKSKENHWMLQTILILIPYFLFSFCFSTLTYSKDLVSTDLENAEQFPYESWVYMGLSDEGGFNPNDVEYIASFPDYKSKQIASRQGIQQRIANYGYKGMLQLAIRKISFTFHDGAFYVWNKLAREPCHNSMLHEFVLQSGKWYDVYISSANAFYLIVLFLFLAGLINELFSKTTFSLSMMCYTAVFGLCIFLMMWETRSRYLLNFTPILLLLSSLQLNRFSTLLRIRKNVLSTDR